MDARKSQHATSAIPQPNHTPALHDVPQIVPRQARQETMLYTMADSRLGQECTELAIKAAVFVLTPRPFKCK